MPRPLLSLLQRQSPRVNLKAKAKEKGKRASHQIRLLFSQFSLFSNSGTCPKKLALGSFRCLKEPKVYVSLSRKESVPMQLAAALASVWVAAKLFRTTLQVSSSLRQHLFSEFAFEHRRRRSLYSTGSAVWAFHGEVCWSKRCYLGYVFWSIFTH